MTTQELETKNNQKIERNQKRKEAFVVTPRIDAYTNEKKFISK